MDALLTIRHLVIVSALCALLATLVAVLLVGAFRTAARQLSRGGLLMFLLACCVATVKAQKILFVNADPKSGDFKTIQAALEHANGAAADDVVIYVAPGVYPPVKVPDIEFDYSWPGPLTPFFDVIAEEGPGTVVIDGQGGEYAITYDNPASFFPRQWHGLVLSNAVCGASKGFFGRCIATACKIGFRNATLEQCIVRGNTGVGALDCVVRHSLITDNHGHSDADAQYDSTGAQNCGLLLSIVWGNTKDGQTANHTNSWGSGTCTDPQLGGICADPLFADPQNRDYRLRMGSPCINAAEIHYLDEYEWDWDFMEDLDGNPRVRRGLVDIGPYEYQPTNDTQTISAPIPVEFAWLDEKCPELVASVGGDYDKLVLQLSANAVDPTQPAESRVYYRLWQSYLMDIDPLDSNAVWRATIEVTNGVPVVRSEPESSNRTYSVIGKHSLTDEVWSTSCEDPRFFRVKVGLK